MSASFTTAEILSATQATHLCADVERFTGVSTDTRALQRGSLFVALEGERFDGHRFLADAARAGATGAVVRRGAPIEAPPELAIFEVDDPRVALGRLARLHRRRFSLPVGAITGTNGKTTTKEMIGAILAARGPCLKTAGNLNNEIGLPRTLLDLNADHAAAIVEMGMNHPGELARLVSYAEPNCAAITNVGAGHLEGLGSIDAVAEAKGELFRGLCEGALAVVNLDDPRVVGQAAAVPRGRWLTFGRDPAADVRLLASETLGDGTLAVTFSFGGGRWSAHLSFVGAHNAQNACCAFAMGLALGCSPEQCVAGIEAARPWAHRLSIAQLPGGGRLIDDCYNANPASMAAGLDTLATLGAAGQASPLAAVLGDMLELGPAELEAHRELGRLAADRGVRLLVTVGPRSTETWRAFVAAAPTAQALSLPDPAELDEAQRFLERHLGPDALLLVKGSRLMRLERLVEALTSPRRGAP